jgi:hypothetical protein
MTGPVNICACAVFGKKLRFLVRSFFPQIKQIEISRIPMRERCSSLLTTHGEGCASVVRRLAHPFFKGVM